MNAPHPRLAIVVSHPIQYYSPWFRWLAAQGWNLRVFYLWDFGVSRQKDREFGREIVWDVDLLSGYDHEFVPNRSSQPGTLTFGGLDNPSLPSRLEAWKPDAILVFGYKYKTQLRLILNPPAPLVFRGDSHLLDEARPSFIKRILLRAVYARFAAVTYTGLANRAYFTAFGVPAKKLFFAPHCVDAGRFAETLALREETARLRARLDIGERRVVLFAGKLIPKKQPRELLEAFLALAPAETALVFVGDGEELPALQSLAARYPEATVRFLPFANQSEMPARYLLADIFALPSRGPGETWGLAVNEAMHLGVPCLVSDRVGCQADLVTDGETGWVFSIEEPEGLRLALDRALADIASKQDELRQRVRERIRAYTYAQAADGLAEAVKQAVGLKRIAL
jgi:glycosyltransferase involved in cell wall biosynthesis